MRKLPLRAARAVPSLSVLALSALVACAPPDDPARGPVTVGDSAGIPVVTNRGPAWAPGEGWQVEEEPVLEIRSGATRLSEPTAEEPLRWPVTAARTGEGGILVSDGLAQGLGEVLVFDSLGVLERRMGGGGAEGAPEGFEDLWWAEPYLADSVAAYDLSRHSVTVFAPDGSVGREVSLPGRPSVPPPGAFPVNPSAYGAYPDGGFLVSPGGAFEVPEEPGAAWSRHLLLRVDSRGEVRDTLGTFPLYQSWWTGRREADLPFSAAGARALHGERLFFGTGERFEIRVYDGQGALERIVRRRWTAPPVTEADIERHRAWEVWRVGLRYRGDPADLPDEPHWLEDVVYPEVKPAFVWLRVDPQGHLWVEEWRWMDPWSVAHPDPRPSTWSVFDPEGRWLGRVEVPAGLLVQEVGMEHLIGVQVDQAGRRHLRVHRLTR